MAGDTLTELLFLDTFKHQSAEVLTNVDVVRFPCGVLITEVRVIPPGIKAHTSLPDNRAFGETSPHSFQLELFFNNLTKPSSACFHRLGSFEYDENKSIVFRPNGKVNTDGLVLRGWYTSLTVAVYGTAERSHGHDRDSPPPPPPPPPQQQTGLKRIIKQEWDKEEQYNGSPPRPAPRGPRTPPGPPPPDDDDEELVPVTGNTHTHTSLRLYVHLTGTDFILYIQLANLAKSNVSMYLCDDGYEQISSDEDDLDNGSFKLPSFDIDYTPEDLASVPPVQYDPYERELRPLLYFTPPYKTRFDSQLERARGAVCVGPQGPGGGEGAEAEVVAQMRELLAGIGEDRDSRWVTALEQASGLLARGLGFLIGQGEWEEPIGALVQWALQGLSMEIALTQPIALNLRQLKAGAKLASCLAECPQGLTALLHKGALELLLELLQVDHVSSTLKLCILRALDALTSAPAGVEAFLQEGEIERSGYQRLVQLFLGEETVRVVTAGNAILQKGHAYEVMTDLQRTAAFPVQMISVIFQDEGEEPDIAMEEETSLGPSPVSEAELDRLAGVLEELHHLLETAPHTMVQPPGKAFPTTARITGPQERDDPYPTLYRYMHACHFLESSAVALSAAVAAGHTGVTHAVREVLHFLSLTQSGLLFMLAQPTPTNLLLRLLATVAEVEGEEPMVTGGDGGFSGPGLGEEGLGVWLMQALHALQSVSELMSHVTAGGEGGVGLEEGDSAEVLSMLHALYLITFTQTGRSAVAHVFSLENNLSCLVTLLQHHSKDGHGEAKARKAVTYNYACMLVLMVVQNSSDLRTMEQHAAPLLILAKADDTNAKLQELSQWLEPLDKVKLEMGSIPSLIDYIKQNVQNVLTLEGSGLMSALRVLCQIACPPNAVEAQQRDLKWSLAGVQLFSGEGLDTCVCVLQKLCSVLLPAWRVHGHMGPTPQRCMILGVCANTLRLLRTMLTELLRSGAFQFRDTRVASTLVTLHMVVCSAPSSGRLDWEETKVQALIVDVLLTFTQGVSEQMTHTEETLLSNTWSLMLKEVLGSLLKAPEGLFSGLTLLSELLPLPLPMQSTQVISVQDVAVALNTRKLWSMHLRVQWGVFADALGCVCGTSCPPLLAMLRRVCVQLADLSSPTATLIMKTLLDVEGKSPGWGQVLRLLSLFDTLVSQRACKIATLHLLSGSAPGDEPLADVFPLLLSLLVPAADHALPQQHCAELVGTVLQSLCDQDISLVVPHPAEGCVSEAEQLANALPGREMISSVCDSLLEVLGNGESSAALLLTCLRTLMFLTEHDYGLYHLKGALKKHSASVCALLKRQVFSFRKDSAELLSALLDFLRQILNTDPLVEPQASPYQHDQPLLTCSTIICRCEGQTVFVLSEVLDEQLKALWFSPFHTDDMEAELDMVKVDLLGLAQECCPELDLKSELERSFLSEPLSPSHTKANKGFRLGKHKHETFITSGKSDYIEPAKRAHMMAAPRGRGRGGFGGQLCRPHDIFRQRKQNTSRPPSMHVDDFVAAEFKDVGTPLGLLPPKRPPKSSPKPPTRGLFTGNRGRAAFHSQQTRFFTPPQPKGVLLSGNYNARREGGRGGTSWSGPLPPVTHRGTYSDARGGQSNFTRGPLPSRQQPAGAYRLAPRDRAPRGRGGTGLSWLSQGGGGGGRGSQGGKFSGGGGSGGGRGRHVRSFTR
uniref:Vir like m6A methyltransferase associated n=1 Tax=Salmo trutta TaxID=8032 RepID=A0A674ENX0_SALTR